MEKTSVQYTVAVSEGGKLESATLRGPAAVNGLFEERDLHSCWDVFQQGKRIAGSESPCLGYRMPLSDGKFGEYAWVSYGECEKRAKDIAGGLVKLELVPETTFSDEKEQKGVFRFLCLYAKNRVEWNLCELASSLQGVTVVPMYDTLGADGLNFIVTQTRLQTVCCSSANLKTVIAHVIASHKTNTPCFKTAVLFDTPAPEDVQNAASAGLAVLSLRDVEAAGRAHPIAPLSTRTSSDICLLMYTSGTTGNPKGVMTSHRMMMAMLPKLDSLRTRFTKTDTIMSYLPSAHVFDRMTAFVFYSVGGRVGFSTGEVTRLLEDAQALKPTCFPAVPRVLNRFHSKIKDTLSSKTGLVGKFIKAGIEAKSDKLDETGDSSHWFYDALFGKLRALLGGKVRLIVCGAAPIAADVLRDFRVFFSCAVVEVYGMTETTGGGCLASDKDTSTEGGVGGPTLEVEVKLVSVPEMGYIADDKDKPVRGEICFRGPAVTPGYFRSEKLTSETIDVDGWLHTGDVGMLLSNGGIKVIDRKKNIFKLAQGEYICPEKIEQVYLRAAPVGQVFLHGESTETFTVAIVVPNEDWLKKEGLDKDDVIGMKPLIKEAMEKVAKEANLLGFEKAKDIIISKEPFTVENGLMTPTMKVKRHECKLKYTREIAGAYGQARTNSKVW